MNFLNQANLAFEQFDLFDLFIRMSVALILSALSGAVSFWREPQRRLSENIIFGGVSLSLIVTMILLVLSANVFYALGLFAALSIIRFRTPVKNVKDTTHLFLCIAIGIACGAGAVKIALFCVIFILAIQQIYGLFSSLKSSHCIIKFSYSAESDFNQIEDFLKKHSQSYFLVRAEKTIDATYECIFDVRLSPSKGIQHLLNQIKNHQTIKSLLLIPQKYAEEDP